MLGKELKLRSLAFEISTSDWFVYTLLANNMSPLKVGIWFSFLVEVGIFGHSLEKKILVVYSSLLKSSKYLVRIGVWALPKNAAPQELFVGPTTVSKGMTGRLQGDPLVTNGLITYNL